MHLQHDVVCPTLIGRDSQLGAVRRVLSHARDGNARVALIVGEAGVGKSRLLRAMTEEARSDGRYARVLACVDLEPIAHKAFEDACRESEHSGRKLDFITQEMLREANTIASKANDAQIARHIVEIKGAIDRLKEQVQNVE